MGKTKGIQKERSSLVIEVVGLTKVFHKTAVVDRVSFFVGQGEVIGLLGENGAGKTTTLRMLATLLQPTEGTARIAGLDLVREANAVRRTLGIIFEGGLYDRLTARENIRYFGRLYGLRGSDLEQRVDRLIETFSIQAYAHQRAGRLSKGMKQKVAIARALVHDPPVLLMDEPTSGLDVTAARLVHDFIRDAKEQGKTVLFSSHNMTEVEKVCDRVCVIHRGRIVASGDLDQLKARGTGSLEEVFANLVSDPR